MARTFNKVILIGNVGKDPEVRTLPSGQKVASFSVATSESYTTRGGEKVEQTTWFRCEAWERLADVVSNYVAKGSQVYLEGRLRAEEYTDNNGGKQTALKLRISELVLLGGRNGDSTPTPAAQVASNAQAAVAASNDEDDLPF